MNLHQVWVGKQEEGEIWSLKLLRGANLSMIVGIDIQPARERDRPHVGIVTQVAPTLHMIEVLLRLLVRAGEMSRYRAIAAEVEGAMIWS
jgi:hypothetical protein